MDMHKYIHIHMYEYIDVEMIRCKYGYRHIEKDCRDLCETSLRARLAEKTVADISPILADRCSC